MVATASQTSRFLDTKIRAFREHRQPGPGRRARVLRGVAPQARRRGSRRNRCRARRIVPRAGSILNARFCGSCTAHRADFMSQRVGRPQEAEVAGDRERRQVVLGEGVVRDRPGLLVALRPRRVHDDGSKPHVLSRSQVEGGKARPPAAGRAPFRPDDRRGSRDIGHAHRDGAMGLLLRHGGAPAKRDRGVE